MCLSQVYCAWQVVKTPAIISNNPVFHRVAICVPNWVIVTKLFTKWRTDYKFRSCYIQGDTKKLLKNPTKIEEIQEKKFIDRNWTIKTCLLRYINPNYQRLKITSCRWRRPPRMHCFTATTHFKSSRCFVSPCVRSMTVLILASLLGCNSSVSPLFHMWCGQTSSCKSANSPTWKFLVSPSFSKCRIVAAAGTPSSIVSKSHRQRAARADIPFSGPYLAVVPVLWGWWSVFVREGSVLVSGL